MLQSFLKSLIKVAGNMGFTIGQPAYIYVDKDDALSYVSALEKIRSQTNFKMIFCVTTNNRADRYSAIKKKCCVDRPVPTQILVAKNLAGKSQMSIATKVAIQMNCKIGGYPWSVHIPLDGLMVVGFDVCHDPKNRERDYGEIFLCKLSCSLLIVS